MLKSRILKVKVWSFYSSSQLLLSLIRFNSGIVTGITVSKILSEVCPKPQEISPKIIRLKLNAFEMFAWGLM